MSEAERSPRAVHDRSTIHTLASLWRNPLFQHELRREDRRACLVAVLAMNAVYVAAFVLARIGWDMARKLPSEPGGAPAIHAEFSYDPWLLAGAASLILTAHWLVPVLALGVLYQGYDLRALSLIVRGRCSNEEALRGQVAAAFAPLAIGSAPLLAGVVLLGTFGLHLAAGALLALLLACVWAAMGAGASLWTGSRSRSYRTSVVRAFALTSLAIPLLVGAVSLTVAWGCSTGQPHPETVFLTAAVLVGSLLVIGLAAAFWDLTYLRMFPERRRSLWLDSPTAGACELEH